MKSAYRFTLALAASLLLLVPVAVFAQTTGTVEGAVTDQSNAPLPGVTVELASPNLQGTRTAVTSADGRYRFPSVPPGPYTVTAELAGFGKVQKRATVTLDATAQVNLSLQLSTTAEITVTGEAPLVDVSSTTQGTNYGAKIIDKLPVGRNYADIVFTQPGVQADFGETQGRSLAISVYGSTSSENLFLIDGVNTTNVIKGFQGKDLNTEFIQEVEVKTGGYQAEYGRNTGGVINVITKSGGNEFHGGVFGYYNDTGMRADVDVEITPDFSEDGTARNNLTGPGYFLSKDVRQEWGADLGGFVIKDKIWFFGAYDRVQLNQNVQPIAGPREFENFPAALVQNKYSGKLTLNPLQGTSIVGSVFSDAQQLNGALAQFGVIAPPNGFSPFTYNGRQDTGGPDYGARLNQLFGSFGIFTFQYAQHRDRYTTKPEGVDVPQFRDYTEDPNGVNFSVAGGFGNVFGPTLNNESKRESYGGSFTAYVGNHEIKLGGDYQNDATSGTTFFTGAERIRIRPCLQEGASICDLSLAPFYTNALGETHQVFYQHDLLADGTTDDFRIIDSSPFSTPTKRYSGFIQDQWRIIPTLTLNAGVRYDSESFSGLDPTTGPFKAFALENQWSPRVGVVWDFVGDGTSKLYASAGRFFFALPTDLNVRVFTANSAVQTYNYTTDSIVQDPNAPRPENFQGGTASGEPVDGWTNGVKNGTPLTKASYQDEVTLGVEKALDPTLSIGLKGTYRTLGRTVEDRCDLDGSVAPNTCALFNPGGDGQAASGEFPTCNGSGAPVEIDPNAGQCSPTGVAIGDAKRIFRGIEMVARKQFTNEIWAQASFLYSSLRGNYSGAIREATGQTDPGINADYDYYQFTFNDYGDLELDRPVQARVDAVYNAPFGLSAGAQFYVRSGLPISRLGWFNDFYPANLYMEERGSFGRTPTDYDLNLSLGYNMAIGPVTVTPQLYVFNVLNRQTTFAVDGTFNLGGSFVTDPSSPFFGQPGQEPGTGTCAATATAPCSDNPDFLKSVTQTNPRLLRVALKVTF